MQGDQIAFLPRELDSQQLMQGGESSDVCAQSFHRAARNRRRAVIDLQLDKRGEHLEVILNSVVTLRHCSLQACIQLINLRLLPFPLRNVDSDPVQPQRHAFIVVCGTSTTLHPPPISGGMAESKLYPVIPMLFYRGADL